MDNLVLPISSHPRPFVSNKTSKTSTLIQIHEQDRCPIGIRDFQHILMPVAICPKLTSPLRIPILFSNITGRSSEKDHTSATTGVNFDLHPFELIEVVMMFLKARHSVSIRHENFINRVLIDISTEDNDPPTLVQTKQSIFPSSTINDIRAITCHNPAYFDEYTKPTLAYLDLFTRGLDESQPSDIATYEVGVHTFEFIVQNSISFPVILFNKQHTMDVAGVSEAHIVVFDLTEYVRCKLNSQNNQMFNPLNRSPFQFKDVVPLRTISHPPTQEHALPISNGDHFDKYMYTIHFLEKLCPDFNKCRRILLGNRLEIVACNIRTFQELYKPSSAFPIHYISVSGVTVPITWDEEMLAEIHTCLHEFNLSPDEVFRYDWGKTPSQDPQNAPHDISRFSEHVEYLVYKSLSDSNAATALAQTFTPTKRLQLDNISLLHSTPSFHIQFLIILAGILQTPLQLILRS